MSKVVLTAQQLLEDSFRLASKVLRDGYEPTLIVAIWRGGTPVGMAVQELIGYCGIDSDHIAIRTASYSGVDERMAKVSVHGLDYIIDKVSPEDRMLIVDDVFDTGHTITAVIQELERRARNNMAEDVRVAVPWYKPKRNQTTRTPDYWVHETEEWLVFPHELDALTLDEMQDQRPDMHAVVAEHKTSL
ncbi:MAG: phosphoribosyltransferase family protein [Gammaproteobacteria bacterium]|nr:phosphoribosyltransferase family protein [Gammaproteobacteria bacterium]MDH3767013.1 phosphoribosyltransferase family protein [Gammaproteobacteria bacterium]